MQTPILLVIAAVLAVADLFGLTIDGHHIPWLAISVLVVILYLAGGSL